MDLEFEDLHCLGMHDGLNISKEQTFFNFFSRFSENLNSSSSTPPTESTEDVNQVMAYLVSFGIRSRYCDLPNLVEQLAKSKSTLTQLSVKNKVSSIFQDIMLHPQAIFAYSEPKLNLLGGHDDSKDFTGLNRVQETHLNRIEIEKNCKMRDLPDQLKLFTYRVLDIDRRGRHNFIDQAINLPPDSVTMLMRIFTNDIPHMISQQFRTKRNDTQTTVVLELKKAKETIKELKSKLEELEQKSKTKRHKPAEKNLSRKRLSKIVKNYRVSSKKKLYSRKKGALIRQKTEQKEPPKRILVSVQPQPSMFSKRKADAKKINSTVERNEYGEKENAPQYFKIDRKEKYCCLI